MKIEQKAKQAAQTIGERCGTRDVYLIAANSGATIVYESWYPTTIGEFEPQTKRILVNERALENTKNAEVLKRAIVAHELGHFFAAEFKIDKTEEERFAREFAKELLS